ncbi:MAG TPA: hypothetical protein VFM56_01515, partial [Solimonas sp.]|nr:hypothetical protein [Solimonas sp.]
RRSAARIKTLRVVPRFEIRHCEETEGRRSHPAARRNPAVLLDGFAAARLAMTDAFIQAEELIL